MNKGEKRYVFGAVEHFGNEHDYVSRIGEFVHLATRSIILKGFSHLSLHPSSYPSSPSIPPSTLLVLRAMDQERARGDKHTKGGALILNTQACSLSPLPLLPEPKTTFSTRTLRKVDSQEESSRGRELRGISSCPISKLTMASYLLSGRGSSTVPASGQMKTPLTFQLPQGKLHPQPPCRAAVLATGQVHVAQVSSGQAHCSRRYGSDYGGGLGHPPDVKGRSLPWVIRRSNGSRDGESRRP